MDTLRARLELKLRFLDFFLATAFVDGWAYFQGYLTTYRFIGRDSHGRAVIHDLYNNPDRAFAIMAVALAVGAIMFLAGLSSRIVLQQAKLLGGHAAHTEDGWLTVDDSGDLISSPSRLHNLSIRSFLLLALILGAGYFWHAASLVLLCLWALAGTQNFPYTVSEIRTKPYRLRRRSTFFGLSWCEEESTEEVVALTLVLEAAPTPTGGYYCVKPVIASGEPIDVFPTSCSSTDPQRSLERAKNWSQALGLPLRIPPAGFVRIGENALLPQSSAPAPAQEEADWTSDSP